MMERFITQYRALSVRLESKSAELKLEPPLLNCLQLPVMGFVAPNYSKALFHGQQISAQAN